MLMMCLHFHTLLLLCLLPPAARLSSPEPKGDFDYTLLQVVVKREKVETVKERQSSFIILLR